MANAWSPSRDAQRFHNEEHQYKHNPQRYHQMQPPKRRRFETLPGRQPPQHVEAGNAGQQDRNTRLPRKSPFERFKR
jgi:hypothetical protein